MTLDELYLKLQLHEGELIMTVLNLWPNCSFKTLTSCCFVASRLLSLKRFVAAAVLHRGSCDGFKHVAFTGFNPVTCLFPGLSCYFQEVNSQLCKKQRLKRIIQRSCCHIQTFATPSVNRHIRSFSKRQRP